MDTVYYGQLLCSAYTGKGDACTNKAYYLKDGKYMCGVHAKTPRTLLPLCPNKAATKLATQKERTRKAENAKDLNNKLGLKGNVIVTKMYMMKPVNYKDGYIAIFPNYKHGNRTDGIGCVSLSPMSMKNLDTKQPGLPLASSLENAHQSAKVFQNEVDKDGEPNFEFFKTQLEMYKSPKPMRHKPNSGKKNIPLYSVWRDANGVLKKFTYIESRQFYCNWYERYASNSFEYIKLVNLINMGYNLQICGYDGYDVSDVFSHYLDDSHPFGHELVLYTMLTHSPETWPWRLHKTEDF